MTPVAPGFDLWQPEDTGTLIGYVIAGLAIIVAGYLAERCRTWHTRCLDRDATIADLQNALADARYERTARQQPLEVSEWVDEPVRSRRRHWHTRASWPGLNCGRLPYGYGAAPLDPARLGSDPCLPPVPDSDELREWILTERLFDTLDPQPGWSIAALPPVVHPRSIFASPASKARLAMTAVWDHPHTNTHQMETARV